MELHHHHHHHHEMTAAAGPALVVGIVMNLLFVFVEVAVGLAYNSLGLLSDAGHNLSDVFGLILAFLAYKLAQVAPNRRYTYGYRKSTILVSLVNAIILLVAVGAIALESVRKLQSPEPIDGAAISWTAGAGIVVNGLTAWMLMKGRKNDLNMKGAFLHMVADTLVSVGVLLSGIVISFTGFTIIDPIISLAIAVVILFSTWSLLADSLRLSMDGVPRNVDMDAVAKALADNTGVMGVHHLHVWAMSTTENALTAHIVVCDVAKMEELKHRIKERLAHEGIAHATLEFETGDACHEKDCECHGHASHPGNEAG